MFRAKNNLSYIQEVSVLRFYRLKQEIKLTEEEPPLPLARMATINKPSFWIFIGACISLYIYNKLTTPDNGSTKSYVLNNLFIFLAAFIGLFLNLIAQTVKNASLSRIFNIVCYTFQITSLALLATKIFLRW